MSLGKVALNERDPSWVLPVSLPYLNSNQAAHDLVNKLRWDGGKRHCPRCSSDYTAPVKTNVFRELYRCLDCAYMFNSLAGTIFQGSKMPVHKYFHFFILHDALGDQLSLRDICFALDCSLKTAGLWLKRGEDIKAPTRFTQLDRRLAATLADDSRSEPHTDAFFSFCEMKGILVTEALLLDYIRGICRNRVPA